MQKNKVDRGGFGIFSLRERLEFQGGQLGSTVAREGYDRCPDLPGCRRRRPAAGRQEDDAAHPSALRAGHRARHTAGKIRILVADDHLVVRDGLVRLLQLQPDFEVVGQAADGQQAVDLALELRPDVVLMDVSMPRLSGIEATRCIVSQVPRDPGDRACPCTATRVLPPRWPKPGPSSYVRKTAPAESLIAAIRAAVG